MVEKNWYLQKKQFLIAMLKSLLLYFSEKVQQLHNVHSHILILYFKLSLILAGVLNEF